MVLLEKELQIVDEARSSLEDFIETIEEKRVSGRRLYQGTPEESPMFVLQCLFESLDVQLGR